MTFVHRYRHCTGSLFRRMFFSPTFPLCPSYVFILSPRKYPNISNISKNIQYFQYFKKCPIFPISQYFQYPNSSNLPKLCIHSTPQQGAMPSSRTQGPRGQDSQSIHFKSHLELTLLNEIPEDQIPQKMSMGNYAIWTTAQLDWLWRRKDPKSPPNPKIPINLSNPKIPQNSLPKIDVCQCRWDRAAVGLTEG